MHKRLIVISAAALLLLQAICCSGGGGNSSNCEARVSVIQDLVQKNGVKEASPYKIAENDQLSLSAAGQAVLNFGAGNQLTLFAPKSGSGDVTAKSWAGTDINITSTLGGSILDKDSASQCKPRIVAFGVVAYSKGTEWSFFADNPSQTLQVAVYAGQVTIDLPGQSITLNAGQAMEIINSKPQPLQSLPGTRQSIESGFLSGSDLFGRPQSGGGPGPGPGPTTGTGGIIPLVPGNVITGIVVSPALRLTIGLNNLADKLGASRWGLVFPSASPAGMETVARWAESRKISVTRNGYDPIEQNLSEALKSASVRTDVVLLVDMPEDVTQGARDYAIQNQFGDRLYAANTATGEVIPLVSP